MGLLAFMTLLPHAFNVLPLDSVWHAGYSVGKQRGGRQANCWKAESSLLKVILHANEEGEAGGSYLTAGSA